MEQKEKLRFSPGTIVLGSTGFVGTRLLEIAHETGEEVLTPQQNKVDLLDPQTIEAYLDNHPGSVCVNLAAHTDLEAAEKERGDKEGLAWKLNFEGVRHLTEATQKRGMFLVHISTDAVFPGTESFPGPYSEDTLPPDDSTPLSWYGYTKLKGEEVVRNAPNTAVVRIAYPFGGIDSPRDFAVRTLTYIKKGYNLFADQHFTPTYIPDLYAALAKLTTGKEAGIYHVACSGITTPYDFGTTVAQELQLTNEVKQGSVVDFLSKPNAVARLIHGSLRTENTQGSLQVSFGSWQESLTKYINENKSGFAKLVSTP